MTHTEEEWKELCRRYTEIRWKEIEKKQAFGYRREDHMLNNGLACPACGGSMCVYTR